MHILIFGSNGRTGKELVRQGLEQGHSVKAFVRNPDSLKLKHERLTVVFKCRSTECKKRHIPHSGTSTHPSLRAVGKKRRI